MWAAEREVWAQDNGYEWFGYTMSPIGDVIDRHVAKREAWLMNCTVRDAAESNGHG